MTRPETLSKKYSAKLNTEGLELLAGLLEMDPKERFSAKEALMHTYFDGLRTSEEEDLILKEREKVLRRVDSL